MHSRRTVQLNAYSRNGRRRRRSGHLSGPRYFGAGGITFSITISCGDGLWEASGVIIGISLPGGAGVVIEGLGADSLGAAGIHRYHQWSGIGGICAGVQIGNNVGANNHFAIDFQPTGPAKLFVTDSFIYNFGASGISGGIVVTPGFRRYRQRHDRADQIPEQSLRHHRERQQRRNHSRRGATAPLRAVSATASRSARRARTSCSASTAARSRGMAFGRGNGSNAGMLVGRSVISGNNTGLFTSSGGVLLSYRDNRLNANTSDGAFTGRSGCNNPAHFPPAAVLLMRAPPSSPRLRGVSSHRLPSRGSPSYWGREPPAPPRQPHPTPLHHVGNTACLRRVSRLRP